MEKILFLMSRPPLPTNDGRSITLFQYIEAMKEDYEIGIVTLKSKKDINKQPEYIKFVKELEMPSFVGKFLNVLNLSLFKRWPLQVAGVYSRKAQKQFNKIVNEFQPDIIICDMIRTSRYVLKSKFDGRKILDMDDILSKRYESSLNTKEDPLGQFKDMLPSFALKIIRILHLNKFILKFEAKAMRKKELSAKDNFSDVILVSPKECEKLNKITGTNMAKCWPVCVNTVDNNKSDYDNNQICFLGNIDASQNQSTLQFIIDNVMNKLPKEVNLLVVGKCSKENMEKFSKYSNVKFTGYVDSIVEYVQDSLCLLAPIQYGSGIKIKVLESMAYKVPVITSSVGAEGLNFVNGQDVIITNDNYAEEVMKMRSDKKYRNDIASNGYKYVLEKHNFEVCKKAILSVLEG